MESQSELRAHIKELLISKSGLKQQIFDNTNALFGELKERRKPEEALKTWRNTMEFKILLLSLQRNAYNLNNKLI